MIYLNNSTDTGEYTTNISPNSPIDKNVTVVESNGTVASMVSLMHRWIYYPFGLQASIKITDPNGDYAYSYSKDDGSFIYECKDAQGNTRTFKAVDIGNDNNMVNYIRFNDVNANPANVINYYVYANDQSFLPHTN